MSDITVRKEGSPSNVWDDVSAWHKSYYDKSLESGVFSEPGLGAAEQKTSGFTFFGILYAAVLVSAVPGALILYHTFSSMAPRVTVFVPVVLASFVGYILRNALKSFGKTFGGRKKQFWKVGLKCLQTDTQKAAIFLSRSLLFAYLEPFLNRWRVSPFGRDVVGEASAMKQFPDNKELAVMLNDLLFSEVTLNILCGVIVDSRIS